jgi:uncharacterized protein (DUF1778 family)
MRAKTSQLQIRIAPAQKARLRQLARRAGLDVSAYMLARALPPANARVEGALRALRDDDATTFAFAEIADALASLTPAELGDAVRDVPGASLAPLTPFARNYFAAMVEHACGRSHLDAPAWTRDIAPLPAPWFAAPLASLRPYLLVASPVPFKRRNLFIDGGPHGRV